MSLTSCQHASPAHRLPLRNKICESLNIVGAIFSRRRLMAHNGIYRILFQCLLDIFGYRNPLQFMDFFAVGRLPNRVHLNSFNEKQSDHSIPNSFNLNKLIFSNWFSEVQLRFFLDFSERTIHRFFVLIDFTFGEIQFFHYFITWIVVNNKQNMVKFPVENQSAEGWDLWFVHPVFIL